MLEEGGMLERGGRGVIGVAIPIGFGRFSGLNLT